jgi:MoxR-like ATPase
MTSERSTGDAAPLAAPAPDTARLRTLIGALETGLLERSAAVRLVLLAALAGEHVLLIGPPGTAKSELARRLHRAFDGARYFERLLTRFSTPEELFGPLSLKALENDRYERLTDGYLPTASIGFIDEVFKANSAILNALLTLLNEREFDNGAGRTRTPLICVIGATNEVPLEEALTAFYDRFLLRVPVAAVSDAAFAGLLELGPAAAPEVAAVSRSDLRQWLAARDAVALPADVVAHLQALRAFLRRCEIGVSDRRWRQLLGVLRTAAFTEGRAGVDALDLWLVPYALAAHPAQVPALQEWYVQHVAQAAPQRAEWLERAVDAFEKQLEIETHAEADASDAFAEGAGKLALARAVGAADDADMARLRSARLDAASRRQYSSVHVAARVGQVDEMLERSREHRRALHARALALGDALAGRVWLPPDLALALQRGVEATLTQLDTLVERLESTRRGFAALPVRPTRAGDAPAPIAVSA